VRYVALTILSPHKSILQNSPHDKGGSLAITIVQKTYGDMEYQYKPETPLHYRFTKLDKESFESENNTKGKATYT
jgi:hypothetical protein